jgi:hypothetical protein
VVRERIVSALDRLLPQEKAAGVRTLLRRVDADPYRDAIRDAILVNDRAKLAELAAKAVALEQPPGFTAFLGGFQQIGVVPRRQLMLAAVSRRPRNVDLLIHLGSCYQSDKNGSADEVVRWSQAAIAAAPIKTDALPASLATAFNISSADNALTTRTPAGGSTVVTPLTTVTAAPRFNAASASAKPILPDDLFEINRTGSISSRVAPTVMRNRSPAKSFDRPELASISSTALTIHSGSLSRPGPIVPHAISPASGSTKWTPSARSWRKFRCVAGCSHMVVFIAGAINTGAVQAR